jgi:hypothetical protein
MDKTDQDSRARFQAPLLECDMQNLNLARL